MFYSTLVAITTVAKQRTDWLIYFFRPFSGHASCTNKDDKILAKNDSSKQKHNFASVSDFVV